MLVLVQLERSNWLWSIWPCQ